MAIGISVPGVSLSSKSVQLKGLNNLANGVVINSFDLPENDPEGGIHLTIQSTVTNVCLATMKASSIAKVLLALASRVLVVLHRLPSILRKYELGSCGVLGFYSWIRVDDATCISWPPYSPRIRLRIGRRIHCLQQLCPWHE